MSRLEDMGLDGLTNAELHQWAVVVPEAEPVDLPGFLFRPMQDKLGRKFFPADLITEADGLLAALFAQLDLTNAVCALQTTCFAMMDAVPGFAEQEQWWPEWEQILGAGLGPQGAEDGWPVGARVRKDGLVRVSRQPNNVNEPLTDAPSTWSRADGRYVVPAGWQYQPGEEVTEDGETWFRVTQATSFRPSESPAQYVQITGPGGALSATAV